MLIIYNLVNFAGYKLALQSEQQMLFSQMTITAKQESVVSIAPVLIITLV